MIDNLYSSALFLVVNNQFLTLSDLSKDTLDEVLDVSLELKKNLTESCTPKINSWD